MHNFVLLSFKTISIMIYVPKLGFLTFCTFSAINFHYFSTYVTCVTRVHVIGDFRHITRRFTAPDMRCLEKRANSDCLEIRRNSTCCLDFAR